MRYIYGVKKGRFKNRLIPNFPKGAYSSILLAVIVGVLAISPDAYTIDPPNEYTKEPLVTNVLSANSEPQNSQQGSTHNSTHSNSSDKQLMISDNNSIKNLSCNSGGPKHASIKNSNSSQLRSLDKLETLCGSAVTNTVSFFAPTPINSFQANEYAYYVATQLKEFAKYNIRPLVFLEPTNNGSILDLNKYKNGEYSIFLNEYFNNIKQLGINGSQIGTWVPFPEGNIPVWGNVDPNTFSANVTITIKSLKKTFPDAKAAILLDSATYPNGDSWSNGSYKSLVPYLKNIPTGLLDSFGLQGFPWSPPANQGGAQAFDPNLYLQTNLAIEAANYLKTKDIWFNTGSYYQAYAYPKAGPNTVTVSADKRLAMLNRVVALASAVKSKNYNTSIHLFTENKTNSAEGIDWSYWQNQEHKNTLKHFINALQKNGISLMYFDVN